MKKILILGVAITGIAAAAFAGVRAYQGLAGFSSRTNTTVCSIHDNRIEDVKRIVAADDLSAFDATTAGAAFVIDSVKLKEQQLVTAEVLADISPAALARVKSRAALAPQVPGQR